MFNDIYPIIFMTELAATEQRNELSRVSFYTINAWYVFGGICLIYIFFNWYLQTQVLTDQVYSYTLAGQANAGKLSAFLDGQHRTAFLGYIMVPLTLLIKMTLVTLCLLTGLLLTSQKLPFRVLFKIVLFAESAFVGGHLAAPFAISVFVQCRKPWSIHVFRSLVHL